MSAKAKTNKLDTYQFLRVVGKGSYGEVHLVEHKKDHKQYVIKKLSLVKVSSKERKAAEQEAQILSRLRHPNIVSYRDSFDNDDGFLYIVMGFAEGGDLYSKLREQREKQENLSEQQVVRWFIQIAMALQYLHERRILHRDLKTQNIFLTKTKMIKVGDLGIARVLETASDMATTLIGTPYYMSPELFQNKAYNHKSDVWALGCCAYEMITLRHAFNAKDMNSLVYKIIKRKLPKMPDTYSTELCELIKSMLHNVPEKRPSVNRILRNPFIKKHIQLFLEESSRRRRPNSGGVNRPRSGPAIRTGGRLLTPPSVEVTRPRIKSTPDLGGDAKLSYIPSNDHILEKSDQSEASIETNSQSQVSVGESGTGESTLKASTNDTVKSDVSFRGDNNNNNNHVEGANSAYPRKLTPTPPPKRDHSASSTSSSSSRKSRPLPSRPDSATKSKEGVSSSKDLGNSLDSVSSNISSASRTSSARQRRRERLEREKKESNKNLILKREKISTGKAKSPNRAASLHQVQNTAPKMTDHRKMSGVADARQSADKRKISISSANDDEFVDLLQTTLRLGNCDPSSSGSSPTESIEAEPTEIDQPEQCRTPAATEISSENREVDARRGISAVTLRSTQRLMDRIVALRKDCIHGLGVPLLHRAYQVIDASLPEDQMQEELTKLLGPVRFDLWAGKIWQLKFCEESMFNHCDTITAIHP